MTSTASKFAATVMAAVAAFSLAACGSKEEAAPATGSSSAAASTSSAVAESPADIAKPTPEELNAVLALATNPQAPIEERILTVQGGETAPELFDVMAQSKQQSGADFVIVPPVLKGYTPSSVLTVVKATLPEREPQTVNDVEFVYEDGHWKLAREWACTLVVNAGLDPTQIPPMCANDPQAPAVASDQLTPPPAGEPAPAPAPAPAPEQK